MGDETYVIPLEAVAECLELPGGGAGGRDGRGVISLRGAALPYVRLRAAVRGRGRRPPRARGRRAAGRRGRRPGSSWTTSTGESQTVIKPLGRLFRGLPGIAGSAILGSGRVALILDVPALLTRALARTDDERDEAAIRTAK